jgi:hypothetical protein
MKKLLYFLFIIFSFTAIAQVPEPHMLWMKGIGGIGSDQIGTNVTKTNDGGFILRFESASIAGTGSIDSFCAPVQKRMVYVKYNEEASIVEWSKCYGTMGDSFLMYMFPLAGGNVVLGGTFNSSSAWGWVVVKHDASGTVLWQRNYSKGMGARLEAMITTNDGGYIMMGGAHRVDTNVLIHYGTWETFDFWIIKVDSNGYKVWSKVIGGTDDETVGALVAAPDNGFYVVGGTSSNDYDCTGNHGGAADAYVARFNDTGGLMWHRCLGGSDYDAATAACSNGKGGVIIAAKSMSTDGDVHNHKGQKDYWVTEVDSSGSIIWDNCYGSSVNFEEPLAVCKATDGSIWVNGYTYKNREDVFLVHADSLGNLLQSVELSSSQKDRGLVAHALPDGLVMVGGYFSLNNGSFSTLGYFGALDIYLITYAPWPAATSDISVANTIKLYPNPAERILHIESLRSNKIQEISIIDMAGRKVLNTRLETVLQAIDLDTEMLPSGLYFVQIVSENGYTEVQKLIVR